mgnify:CR=1 FL=1
MSRKSKPSKISIRQSLFPNVSPYIDFSSCIHNHHLPAVRIQDIQSGKNYSQMLASDIVNGSHPGSGLFLLRKREPANGRDSPSKSKMYEEKVSYICFQSLYVTLGIGEMFNRHLGKLFFYGERL